LLSELIFTGSEGLVADVKGKWDMEMESQVVLGMTGWGDQANYVMRFMGAPQLRVVN
jgi:hypothetical protein